MTETKRLLAIKAQLKKRQPKYGRQESYLKKLDQTKWRTPKGLHIKVGERGHPAMLEKGYGTPKAVRGMTSKGLYPVRVATMAQLEALDAKTQCAIIGKVGGKRRVELIEAAVKMKITIVNGDEKVASRLKERFTQHAQERKEKSAAKAKRAAETEKKASKKSEAKPSEEAAAAPVAEQTQDVPETEEKKTAPKKKAKKAEKESDS